MTKVTQKLKLLTFSTDLFHTHVISTDEGEEIWKAALENIAGLNLSRLLLLHRLDKGVTTGGD